MLGLTEGEGLGDVGGLEVVLAETRPADVALGDRGRERAGNETERRGRLVRQEASKESKWRTLA